MKNGEIDWTFDNLSFLVLANPYLQVALGVISLLVSFVLFYVVIKSTPDELIARRANVITQLVGCVIQSVMYSIILQPIPLFPHRAIIITGPFRHLGSFACTILFVLWTSNITFTANSAMSSSVSHYLGTMEGMRFGVALKKERHEPHRYAKQKNPFLEWYAKQTFRTKSIIITCSHTFVAVWSAISLFLSIDFNSISNDRQLAFLIQNHALLHMHSRSVSLAILGISFTLFTILYLFQLLYLNRGVWLQLNEIKSSISPRTWEILHHTSLLFLGIAIQPIVSFIIPTAYQKRPTNEENALVILRSLSPLSEVGKSCNSFKFAAMFILFNFAVTSLESSLLLNLTVWTTIILYTSSPFLFYLLTLISFKIYRHHFFAILRSPFACIVSRRPRRISVFPQHEEEQSNKYAT